MRSRTVRAGAVLLVLALALPIGLGPVPATAQKGRGNPRFYDLRKAPKPKISGKQIIEGLEDFVTRFPMRHNGLPNNAAAAEFLAKEARKNGFKTRILEFEGLGTPERTCKVVQSVKRGTNKPNEWIAFIAHYDVVAGGGFTIQGAYDDGSGTNMIRFFGKAFKKIKTNRSIALLWFDCEENGLLASRAYAESLKKQGQKIHAGLGFDMVGIGWPANYCICIFHGPAPEDAELAVPVIKHVNFDFMKAPEGDGEGGLTQKWPIGGTPHVCSCGPNPRNSDEQSFAAQGWFTMRWAGMRAAIDYPGYHQPWDTVPFMELVAGGRENLEKGTENTFMSAFYTAIVLDHLK
jgi:hypothetical protein